MNSRMSGWSTRRMPIFAPRRVPPCLIVSVAMLKTLMNETGPLATPLVRTHGVVLGPELLKREPGAAAALMDQRDLLDGIENLFHGIVHRKHETGGKLLELPAGIHQGRANWAGIRGLKECGKTHPPSLRRSALAVIQEIGLGDVVRHPAEHFLRRFHHVARVRPS